MGRDAEGQTRFVRKSVNLVDAWQVTSLENAPDWIHNAYVNGILRMHPNSICIVLRTGAGQETVGLGSWLVRNENQEISAYSDTQFWSEYEPVET